MGGLALTTSTYLPILNSISPLTTKIWKVVQNVKTGVVWGGQGSPKVIEIAPFDRAHTIS